MNKVYILVLVFLVVGGVMIYNNVGEDDNVGFFKGFFTWTWNVVKNVKDVTGYVVSKEWMPNDNNTNFSNSTLEELELKYL